MTVSVEARRKAFFALHENGCFVLPNPWDAGSAQRLEKLGFVALASTSSGAAATLGRQDYELTLDEVLDHLRALSAATDLPLNADFENGFADAPEDVARNAILAAQTGVAGLSIEDYREGGLYDAGLAVERVRAVREAIDREGDGVLLVARAEGLLHDPQSGADTIERLVRFKEAGADCLYAPGVRDPAVIAEMVAAVAPKPLNVLLMGPQMRVADLAELGVRRVSVGGSLARAAWNAFEDAARSLLDNGALPELAYRRG